MADLSRYWFYHGTTLKDAKDIKYNNHFKLPKDRNGNLRIGSLGYGSYAFAKSFHDALERAKEKSKSLGKTPVVLQFRLKEIPKIFDFTLPNNIMLFNKYTINEKYSIKGLHYKNKGGINGTVNKLDGAVINLFLRFISKMNRKYYGVYNPSQNKTGGQIIKNSRIPNSMELSIRNDKIIDFPTMHILNEKGMSIDE